MINSIVKASNNGLSEVAAMILIEVSPKMKTITVYE